MHNFVYLAKWRSQEFSCEPNSRGGGRAARQPPLTAPHDPSCHGARVSSRRPGSSWLSVASRVYCVIMLLVVELRVVANARLTVRDGGR